jgi:hypothetical protein
LLSLALPSTELLWIQLIIITRSFQTIY